MQDKSAVIAIYALTGLVIALWPLWITEKGVVAASGFQFLKSIRSTTALGLAALGVILITGESIASPLILGFGLIALATSMSGGKLDVVAMSTSFLAVPDYGFNRRRRTSLPAPPPRGAPISPEPRLYPVARFLRGPGSHQPPQLAALAASDIAPGR